MEGVYRGFEYHWDFDDDKQIRIWYEGEYFTELDFKIFIDKKEKSMEGKKLKKGDYNYDKWVSVVDFVGVTDQEKRDWLINYFQQLEDNSRKL